MVEPGPGSSAGLEVQPKLAPEASRIALSGIGAGPRPEIDPKAESAAGQETGSATGTGSATHPVIGSSVEAPTPAPPETEPDTKVEPESEPTPSATTEIKPEAGATATLDSEPDADAAIEADSAAHLEVTQEAAPEPATGPAMTEPSTESEPAPSEPENSSADEHSDVTSQPGSAAQENDVAGPKATAQSAPDPEPTGSSQNEPQAEDETRTDDAGRAPRADSAPSEKAPEPETAEAAQTEVAEHETESALDVAPHAVGALESTAPLIEAEILPDVIPPTSEIIDAEIVPDAEPQRAEAVEQDQTPAQFFPPQTWKAPQSTKEQPAKEQQPAKQQQPAPRRLKDPEEQLADHPWTTDPRTLRETATDPEPLYTIQDRLTDKLEYAERDVVRARLLSLRAVIGRVLGESDQALADGREALQHAEASGDVRLLAVVKARVAQVQQWRGDFAEADRLYAEANSGDVPERLRAEIHVNAGRSCFEQGRYLEACNQFEQALELRRDDDSDLAARAEAALDAVMTRVQDSGWGPYQRTREEILQQDPPPQPTSNTDSLLMGYADSAHKDSAHTIVIAEQFAEAQPFSEGAAWVRRPDGDVWELIDESGATLIGDASAYRQISPFSEGLAWVSRELEGEWFAIDWHNRVIVAGSFDDVRPFKNGLAVVRRGDWGALDRHGRVVVAPRYSNVVMHSAGFLIQQGELWGALDRSGEPLAAVSHATPAEVAREIDGRSADFRPVL